MNERDRALPNGAVCTLGMGIDVSRSSWRVLVICDQTIVLGGFYSNQGFPEPLRRIKFRDPKTGTYLVFLTNNSRCRR